jgi:hypothetical protein
MGKHLVSALAVAALGLVACDRADAPPPRVAAASLSSGVIVDACRGAQFDADEVDARCLHHRPNESPPAASALKVAVHADSVAKSGNESTLVVEMRNVSGDPLVVDVDNACGFEVVASNDQATSYESECTLECVRGPEPRVARVQLEPDGVIVKKLRFWAIQKRVMSDGHRCTDKSLGTLPPGRYQVKVALPWSDEGTARSVAIPMTVTP